MADDKMKRSKESANLDAMSGYFVGSFESSVDDKKQRNSFEECMKRLRQAVGAASDVELAKALGIKQPSVASARSRKKIPSSWILEIAKRYRVSADWILYGEGPMYRDVGPSAPQEAHQGGPSGQKNATAQEEEFCFIPKVAAVLNAGHGSWITEDRVLAYYAFRRDWIKTVGSAAHMVLMELQGDSMYPTLHPGDHLLIDTSQTTPRQGAIMAVGIDECVLAKRVNVRADSIVLISDNKMYDPIIIKKGEPSEIRWLGRIVWLARQLR